MPSAAAALIVDIRLGDAGVEGQEWNQEPQKIGELWREATAARLTNFTLSNNFADQFVYG